VAADRPQGVRALSFASRLDATARRAPDRLALVAGEARLTYGQLDRCAAGFARWLQAQGAQAGGRVALVLPNGIGFAVGLYGALKLGVTVAPLNPQLTADERSRILADFKPALVVDSVPMAEVEGRAVANVDGPALVLYTSGSTGRPKGAVLSHAALAFAVDSWCGPVMALTEADVVLGVLPFAVNYVRTTAGGRTAFFFADLVPTTAHLAYPWIMGYDLYPLTTLENKKRWIPEAVKNEWLCFFAHDPQVPAAYLREREGKVVAEPVHEPELLATRQEASGG